MATPQAPIDHGWAWMVALGGHIVNFFVIGGYKSLGILFVELLDHFHASSAFTAMIFGIMSGGMSVLSPISTALGSMVTYRVVIMVGGVLVCVSAFLTSFAPSIEYVVVVFGVGTGIAYGCLLSPSLVLVGQYFDKRRATANGIVMAGGSVGQLCIPQLMRVLIDWMTFRGALMIYAGLTLNILVAGVLMRPLSFYNRGKVIDAEEKKNGGCLESEIEVTVDCNGPGKKAEQENTKAIQLCGDTDVWDKHAVDSSQNASQAKDDLKDKDTANVESQSLSESKRSELNEKLLDSSKPGENVDKNKVESQNKPDVKMCKSSTQESCMDDTKELIPSSQSKDLSQKDNTIIRLDPEGDSQVSLSPNGNKSPIYASTGSLCIQPHQELPASLNNLNTLPSEGDLTNVEITLPPKENKCRTLWDAFEWSVFSNYVFLVYTMGIMLGNCGYVNCVLFMPPYAEELHISKRDASILLSLTGAVDLVGRLGGGWFADLGLIKRNNIMAITIWITGIAAIVFPLLATFWSLVLLCVVLGLLGGTYISLVAVVFVDLLGVHMLARAFGMTIMCMGMWQLPIPSILGAVRDIMGGYQIPYIICAVQMLLAGCCFFSLPWVQKWEKSAKERRIEKRGYINIKK